MHVNYQEQDTLEPTMANRVLALVGIGAEACPRLLGRPNLEFYGLYPLDWGIYKRKL